MSERNSSNRRSSNAAYFHKWYDQKKDALSEARKKRYKTDPEYRKKCIANARRYRQRKAEERQDIPPQYKYSSRDAADAVGVTTNDLRAWRLRDHYPTPMTVLGRQYFTETQVALLQRLNNFLTQHGPRIKQEDRPAFEDLKALIAANWES